MPSLAEKECLIKTLVLWLGDASVKHVAHEKALSKLPWNTLEVLHTRILTVMREIDTLSDTLGDAVSKTPKVNAHMPCGAPCDFECLGVCSMNAGHVGKHHCRNRKILSLDTRNVLEGKLTALNNLAGGGEILREFKRSTVEILRLIILTLPNHKE
jgi:hypothetical protein